MFMLYISYVNYIVSYITVDHIHMPVFFLFPDSYKSVKRIYTKAE